jgi:hypothetical protein
VCCGFFFSKIRVAEQFGMRTAGLELERAEKKFGPGGRRAFSVSK